MNSCFCKKKIHFAKVWTFSVLFFFLKGGRLFIQMWMEITKVILGSRAHETQGTKMQVATSAADSLFFRRGPL